MGNKEFIRRRICIFAKREFDPAVDEQVVEVLREVFNVHLPQRVTLKESLESTTCVHEIIQLLLKYRAMK